MIILALAVNTDITITNDRAMTNEWKESICTVSEYKGSRTPCVPPLFTGRGSHHGADSDARWGAGES